MNRWLLPEGIEEVVADQAIIVESIRRQLLDLFELWGYELIFPPVIEYTDSLLTGLGEDLDSKTIKVADQVSGKMIGFRADISPQAARIDARISDPGPRRLCYAGTVLHSAPADALTTRAPIQIGAELFGVDSVSADFEIMLLTLQALGSVTREPLTLDLGHVAFCQWLNRVCDENDLPTEDLYQLIQAKRIPELERVVDKLDVDPSLSEQLLAMPSLVGPVTVLDRAAQVFQGVPEIASALDDLRTLANALAEQSPDTALFFDLGEMRGSNYHTGVVFAVFVDDKGVAKRIANGGRYNNVGKAFGRSRAATGFSMDLKRLIQIFDSQQDERYAVFAPVSGANGFWEQVSELRADGVRVLIGHQGDGASAQSLGCQQVLVFEEGEWKLEDA